MTGPTITPIMGDDDFVDAVRAAVLAALDECAAAYGLAGGTPGATDADLPRLFRALDAQAALLIERRKSTSADALRKRLIAILLGKP